MQKETARKQQEEEAWYRQQQLLLDAEEKRRRMIQTEEQKLVDQRKRSVPYHKQLCGCIMSQTALCVHHVTKSYTWYVYHVRNSCDICVYCVQLMSWYQVFMIICFIMIYIDHTCTNMYYSWIIYTVNDNLTQLPVYEKQTWIKKSLISNTVMKQKLFT